MDACRFLGSVGWQYAIKAHCALADFSYSGVKLRNVKWTSADAEFTPDAFVLVNDYRTFSILGDGFDGACFCASGYFAVHASPIEKAPLGVVRGLVVLQLELDMSPSLMREVWWIGPFCVEFGVFAWKAVPSLACNLTASATNAFRRVH